MSVIGSNILAGASGQGGGYNLTNSLRFRRSASANLTRTPPVASNRDTWTWSGWVKRGSLSSAQSIFSTRASVQYTYLRFESNDTIGFRAVNGSSVTIANYTTSAVFRDPSAWYHIVLLVDTTQATAGNRVILYVNGVSQSLTASTTITQNTDMSVNNDILTGIGFQPTANSEYLDGYMTEINFIDGQALTPSSFGEYSATTGVWQPKKYAGTYGTNGFYLPFTNTASTSTLGNDFSGNGNNWTTNNISLTAGATYDSMTDVCALTSATASNYPVFNNLKRYSANLTVSNANLTATETTATVSMTSVTMSFGISGKYYFECDMTSAGGSTSFFGVSNAANIFSNSITPNSGSYRSSGAIYDLSGGRPGDGNSYVTGDVIGVAVDVTAGTVQFYKNNVAQGNTPSFTFTAGTELWAFVACDNEAGTKTFSINFGQRPFAYTPPTGFVALNTFNLPTPTIGATASTQANKYFDATTYTGNGATQTIINSGGMQPSFVWMKGRNYAQFHDLTDAIRGGTKVLSSNSTAAEVTDVSNIQSFNSNGFTLGPSAYSNADTATFVAWQWAGNGTGVTNTAGSITSTVSANTSAGFSIVTYTGTGANATVGHGLGVAPSMVIAKSRSQPQSWVVWFKGFTGNEYLLLNATSAKGSAASIWNSTVPTSSVFSIGTDVSVNISGATQVAYCFSEVAGYSRFGSYTGNGSADGTFVYTGFRPAFIMIKRTDSTGFWTMLDNKRLGYNVTQSPLYANSANAESTAQATDFTSNGFKLRTTDSDVNASGSYIYMAFAENPFKYSLAR